MEHRLIQGGEQWLPFARGRVKALRATGLGYASQKFEIDGCSIRVTIQPGYERIEISGGVCELRMDSGIADLISVRELDPALFLPAVLYEAAAVGAYNADFEFPDSGYSGKWRDWRLNLSRRPVGQMSGNVLVGGAGGFTGRVPADQKPAKSFAPQKIQVTPATDPVTWKYADNDELLERKKLAAAYCPASMFTGRCRLYVQALYGSPLYIYEGGDPGNKPTANELVSLGPMDGNGYSLFVSARKHKDGASGEAVKINTSTGVYFDPVTGKHTLINIEFGVIVAYPLVGSSCAESARKFIRADSSKLPDGDKERLEAYILASCLPDAKRRKIIGSVGDVDTFWSMGYGWHWNWDGTAADMVVNHIFEQGAGADGMESTHRRITVGISEGDMHASLSVVEGPIKWAIPRTLWCIAEPLWAARLLVKTTPKRTNPFDCNAPFYVFYLKNELKVCRVKVTSRRGDEPSRTVVGGAGFASPVWNGPVLWGTTGALGGSAVDFDRQMDYSEAQIDVGDETVSGLFYGKGRQSGEYRLFDKARITEHPEPSSFSDWGGGIPEQYQVGYPPYEIVTETPGRRATTVAHWDWRETTATTNEYSYGLAAIAVPMHDAEAVYMWSRKVDSKSRFGEEKYFSSKYPDNPSIVGNQWSEMQWHSEAFGAPLRKYERFSYAGNGGRIVSSSAINEPTAITSDVVESRLVSRAGATEATFVAPEIFFENSEELIPSSYHTLSGTRIDQPVVIAPGRIESIGASMSLDTSSEAAASSPLPALVGWV